MSSLIYFVLFGFVAVTFVVWMAGMWRHNKSMAAFGFGASLIMVGIVLNMAGLRHTLANGKSYGWGALPDWAYVAPILVGTAFVVLAWLPKLRLLIKEWHTGWKARRAEARATKAAAKVANKRHARPDTLTSVSS